MSKFVVVPNWNGAELICKCLDSLKKQDVELEIVVVDNGSSDNSVELIQSKYPEVKLIQNKQNLGFAGGVNVGINYALSNKARYIGLINNDAYAEKGWARHLIDALKQNDNAGIATGKFMRDDKKHFDSTGDFYSIWGIPFPRGRNLVDSGQFNSNEKVFGATGGASLYRAGLFKDIGLFDEEFFAYYEDVDLSFRAQLAGWRVAYAPAAVAYHHVGATSSKLGSFTRYHSIKNFLMLYTKNMPLWLYLKYLPLFLSQIVRFGVSSTIKGGLLAYLKAVISFLFLVPSTLGKRFKIQKSRMVSVAQIDALLYHNRPPKIPKI